MVWIHSRTTQSLRTNCGQCPLFAGELDDDINISKVKVVTIINVSVTGIIVNIYCDMNARSARIALRTRHALTFFVFGSDKWQR